MRKRKERELISYLISAEEVIRMNREVREADGMDWPAEYLVVGEWGAGSYFAVDVDDSRSGVYFWNKEVGYFDEGQERESLEELAGELLEAYRRCFEELDKSGKEVWGFLYWPMMVVCVVAAVVILFAFFMTNYYGDRPWYSGIGYVLLIEGFCVFMLYELWRRGRS